MERRSTACRGGWRPPPRRCRSCCWRFLRLAVRHRGRSRPEPVGSVGHAGQRADVAHRVVHPVAGGAVDRAHGAPRARPGVRGGALPVPRPAPARRPPHRHVRAADGGDGCRGDGGAPDITRPRCGRDRRGPRGVQPRRGRAHGRRDACRAPPRSRGRGGHARRSAVAHLRRRRPPPPAFQHRRGRRHRVRLHVHVLWRRPPPRWPTPLDDRGGGVASGDPVRRSRCRGDARPVATRARRRVRRPGRPTRPPGRADVRRPGRRTADAPAARPPAPLRRPRRHGDDGRRGDTPARPRVAIAATRRPLLVRRLDAPRPHRGAARHQPRRRPAAVARGCRSRR